MNGLSRTLIICLFIQLAFGVSRQPVELVAICSIQGSGFTANHLGETVRTRGVVYADLDETYQRGFFMQAQGCDPSANTSDGIFVYLGERLQVVNPGDSVEVSGVVQEYYGMTEIVAAPADVTVLSGGNLLPAPQELNPPFANNSSRYYFETLEGMYASLGDGRVVGPTDADDRTWLARTDLGLQRVMQDDPAGTGEVICADDGGLEEITPEVEVGDRVQGLLGALDYRFGVYCLSLTTAPAVTPPPGTRWAVPLPAERPADELRFDIATFNLANLFDTIDDPNTDDSVLSPTEYQRRLDKRALAIHDSLGEPVLIAVQEVENQAVLQDLIARPELLQDYGIVHQDGPDRRGLDVALLYQINRVQVLEAQWRQACTTLVDGLGPDGNLDVYNPQNSVTCDSDGDGLLDGNRLVSRPPLVVHLRVCQASCASAAPAADPGSVEFWVIIGHWKSKTEDSSTVQYTLPRRTQEAEFVASLVDEILASEPGAALVVAGDLNDYPASQPLSILYSRGLDNLSAHFSWLDRYTYIFQGISGWLDYVLVRPSVSLAPVQTGFAHINTDYPYSYQTVSASIHRSSDHDPMVVELIVMNHWAYLPLVSR